jgi:predicted short-subunit dehydrogenase-like oxidoreductase (DUF2520 family)
MNVSFIGSGNLAWHLAPALDNTEFPVKEVYSLNPQNAEALVEKLYHATTKASLDFSLSLSRVFIMAVADDAIQEIAQEIILPENALLVHTSGSQPLSALAYAAAASTGVFYPLQTFTKGRKIDLREVPIFIESENAEAEKILKEMAKAVSKKVFTISSEDRKALHVAAVFASNFTNHMIALCKDILDDRQLSFELVKPLIAETINKSLSLDPNNAQTGPARRGDLEILDRHVEFLQNDEAVAEIYKIISQHIVDRYHE